MAWRYQYDNNPAVQTKPYSSPPNTVLSRDVPSFSRWRRLHLSRASATGFNYKKHIEEFKMNRPRSQGCS